MSVFDAVGSYRSAGRTRKGYKRASAVLQQLRGTAEEVRDQADPFRTYRPEIARYLSDLVMGRRDIEEDPGYQFAFDESMRGVSRQAKAMGMGESGNVLAALQERAGGLASQQYGSIIERLQSLAAATPGNATAGAQLFGNIESQRIAGQATAQLGSAVAEGQQRGALWSGISSIAGMAAGGATGGGVGALFGGLGPISSTTTGSSTGYITKG